MNINKELLIKRIKLIDNKKCYIKLFNMILDDNINYSKNSNGVYINISILSDEILDKIDKIVRYYENNKKLNNNW